MSKEQFKVYLSHEAAHILDSGQKYSNMSEWRSVMSEDAKLAANGKAEAFPTEYAATNACEDFAESMMMFLNDRKKLKEICPNREHFLHELTKRLGKR